MTARSVTAAAVRRGWTGEEPPGSAALRHTPTWNQRRMRRHSKHRTEQLNTRHAQHTGEWTARAAKRRKRRDGRVRNMEAGEPATSSKARARQRHTAARPPATIAAAEQQHTVHDFNGNAARRRTRRWLTVRSRCLRSPCTAGRQRRGREPVRARRRCRTRGTTRCAPGPPRR
jgi:hypothetical protein